MYQSNYDQRVLSGCCCATTLDKAPPFSISIVIWILSSDTYTDTICQLNQFNTNSEAAMLSTPPESPSWQAQLQSCASSFHILFLKMMIELCQFAIFKSFLHIHFLETILMLCQFVHLPIIFPYSFPENFCQFRFSLESTIAQNVDKINQVLAGLAK